MAKSRQLWLLTAVVIVALLGAGYFFGAKPQSAKAKSIQAETAAQDTANRKLRGEIDILEKQATGVIAQETRLRQIAAIVPAGTALPKLIRSMTTISTDTGAHLTSMAPGAVVALADEAPAAVATTAPTEETTPVDGAPAPAPRKAAPLVYEMPVALTVTGNFTELQLFIAKLEKLDRAYVVDALTVTPEVATGATPGAKKAQDQLRLGVSGRVFVKPPVVAAAPVAITATTAPKK